DCRKGPCAGPGMGLQGHDSGERRPYQCEIRSWRLAVGLSIPLSAANTDRASEPRLPEPEGILVFSGTAAQQLRLRGQSLKVVSPPLSGLFPKRSLLD